MPLFLPGPGPLILQPQENAAAAVVTVTRPSQLAALGAG